MKKTALLGLTKTFNFSASSTDKRKVFFQAIIVVFVTNISLITNNS